jgi:hypothetical protein
MGGVRTSIIGRPRPLPGPRADHRYTLNCEEPDICTDPTERLNRRKGLSGADGKGSQFLPDFPTLGQTVLTVGEIQTTLSLSGQICQGDVRVTSLCDRA